MGKGQVAWELATQECVPATPGKLDPKKAVPEGKLNAATR